MNIKQIVCEYFNLGEEQLLKVTRKREIVQARQIAMYFEKENSQGSLEVIGARYGKDHTTVIHSCKNIKNLMETDKEFWYTIAQIEMIIKANCIIKHYATGFIILTPDGIVDHVIYPTEAEAQKHTRQGRQVVKIIYEMSNN